MDIVAALDIAYFDQARRDNFGGFGVLGGRPADPGADLDGRSRVLNSPARVEVTVLQPYTFTVVARTWSRPDGTWEVLYLDTAQQFMVIGTDRSRQVNSAIQDWVYPAPMDP